MDLDAFGVSAEEAGMLARKSLPGTVRPPFPGEGLPGFQSGIEVEVGGNDHHGARGRAREETGPRRAGLEADFAAAALFLQQGDIGIDHDFDELFESDFRLPAELACGF